MNVMPILAIILCTSLENLILKVIVGPKYFKASLIRQTY